MDSQLPPNGPPVENVDALPPSPSPGPAYGVLIGPDGLRAGWKCAVFFLVTVFLLLGLMPLVISGLPSPRSPEQTPLKTMLVMEIFEASVVLLITGIMAKAIDRQKWGYFGLPLSQAFRSKFWIGAITGFCALAIQLELMHLGGWFDFGPVELHGTAALKYGAAWGLLFLCTGFFEEGFLRGYPQRVLTDGMRFWPAAIVLSLVFSLVHLTNGGENEFGLCMIFIDGMLMCWALWRTGNMWFGVGNHAAWDWAQTFFFGTPDSGMKPLHALFSPSFHGPTLLSGGTAGPEGSVLVVISEALIAIFVFFAYPKRQYPLKEDASALVGLPPSPPNP